jgi:cell division protein FtsZ
MGMVNKAMDALGSKFNCRNSMIMGASIDGSFYNQLRITIMGTIRHPSLTKGFAPVPAASIPPNQPLARPLKPAEAFPQAETEPLPASRTQEEFPFPSQEENRGLFEKTLRNLYEGMDLDIPTYLRRGLKISRG